MRRETGILKLGNQLLVDVSLGNAAPDWHDIDNEDQYVFFGTRAEFRLKAHHDDRYSRARGRIRREA